MAMAEARGIGRLALRLLASCLRHTPLTRGRWRLLKRAVPLQRSVGPGMAERVVRTRRGFRMRVDPGDWIEGYIYLTGGYEEPIARLIEALAAPGDTVIDVGANCGFHALVAARRVGGHGRVHAFEPVAGVRARLAENVRLNAAQNVEIHGRALLDRNGTVAINEALGGNKGLSSIRRIPGAARAAQVESARLDALPLSRGRIALIKIDVEGAEEMVVDGMLETLARQHPHLIIELTEEYMKQLGTSGVSLCRKLTGLGYRVFQVTEEGLAEIEDPARPWPGPRDTLFTVDAAAARRLARAPRAAGA